MPVTLALNDVVRLRVACYTANQQGVNVCHFQVTTVVGTGQTDAQVAGAFDTALAARYKAVLSVAARYRGVSIQRILPLPPTYPQIVTTSDGVGTVAGDMMSTQTSGIVSAKTEFAGPKYRGRAYIPFPGEASNDANGLPIAGYVTDLEDIGDELYTPVVIGGGGNTVTLTPCIYHRATATVTKIDGYTARAKWATQRRRGSFGQVNPTPF